MSAAPPSAADGLTSVLNRSDSRWLVSTAPRRTRGVDDDKSAANVSSVDCFLLPDAESIASVPAAAEGLCIASLVRGEGVGVGWEGVTEGGNVLHQSVQMTCLYVISSQCFVCARV